MADVAARGHWRPPLEAAGGQRRRASGRRALGLKWQVGPPRVIGLISIPVLKVSFRFAGLDEQQRYAFMKRFDLYMQRGGG